MWCQAGLRSWGVGGLQSGVRQGVNDLEFIGQWGDQLKGLSKEKKHLSIKKNRSFFRLPTTSAQLDLVLASCPG
jgi:hypothetical protein